MPGLLQKHSLTGTDKVEESSQTLSPQSTAPHTTYTVFLYNSWSVKTPPSILHFVVSELLPFLTLLRGISRIFVHAVGEHVRVEVNLSIRLLRLKCSSNSSWNRMEGFPGNLLINLLFFNQTSYPFTA